MPLIERPCLARAAGARRSPFISASVGHDVTLWGRDRDADRRDGHASGQSRRTCRISRSRTPVRPTPSLADALAGARHVIVAVPSHGLRARDARGRAASIPPDAVLVSATKGIEADTLQRMSEVMHERDRRRAIRSSCCPGRALRRKWRGSCRRRSSRRRQMRAAVRPVQDEFRGPAFRLYGSDDVVGVEIGAALKNIIAIAAGVVESHGPRAQRAWRRSSRAASRRSRGWRARWAAGAKRWPA